MSVLEKFIALVAPHHCLNCGMEGVLLCDVCVARLPRMPSRCYRCLRLTDAYAVCTACRKSSALAAVFVATTYTDTAKKLIRCYKFERAQAAKHDITRIIAARFGKVPPDTLFVPVPTATSRVRERGYDQAKLMARQLARACGGRYAPLLLRSGQSKQVGASGQMRRMQLADAFRVTSADMLRTSVRIILVDDVLTTGATLEAAGRVLKRAGAQRVTAVVFAQAVRGK
jgi:ComF family protein